MDVKQIEKEKLRSMKEKEGLVLQGCGGDLRDWVNGINDMLTEEKILLEDTKFKDCVSFEHEECTCILFPFDDVKIDMGRLAMWRIRTHEHFGGTWLSDFVDNKFGGFIDEESAKLKEKPDCPLIGQDGNIFNLMGIASRCLKQNGMSSEAKEMVERITGGAASYHEALNIIGEYVNITSVYDDETEDFDVGMEMNL